MKKFAILVTLSLILSWIVSGCSKPNPQEPATAYLDAWMQSKYEEMYDLLSVGTQSSIAKQDFINRYTNIFSAIKLYKLEIDAEEIVIEDKRAYLPFKAKFHTNTVGTFEYQYTLPLVLEEKQWKIEWSPSLIFPIMQEGDKVRITRHSAKRGTISDRQGNLLATNGPAYTVGAKPSAIPNIESFAKALAPLIEMDEGSIQNILNQKWVKDNPDLFVPIKNLPFNISEEYKSKLLSVKGVMLSSKSHITRQYPMEQLFAHVTGYVQQISKEELEKKASEGYDAEDLIGRQGIEAALEEELKGRKGYTLYIEDQYGKQKSIIAKVEPQDGNDVILTIDPLLQKAAYEALKGSKGSIIALNPATGEILAMVSQPSFDPNIFPVGVLPSEWKALSQDPDHPLINRCIHSLYPPGSTFKPFTAAMALESGVITLQTVVPEAQKEEWIPSPNWTAPPIRRVPHPPGDVNLRNAIVWSDNIFFAWTGLKIGYKNFETFATRYGLGQSLPFTLPVKSSQIKNASTSWSDALLANTSYGQGEMLITPLQMATMYTAFYNSGNMMLPQLVKEIRTPSGQTTESLQPKPWLEGVIPKQYVDTLLPMLIDTVEDPTGTAHKVKIPELTIAGKTGTAQVRDKSQEIAWFIGFTLNTEKPLLVCVALEVPAGEGDVKLDIAKRMFAEYYR
ncbi:penicillin-binding protein [Caldicoprobacter guelmensis]|uniref:penicillin-binding transpeptidase domain-containing protein n=1 Tax=Caldicoprobacter guelmensis TaxID=1170224 RepID=UPI0019567492|nr:penicillin-binding transpeptidase domain-containing protein [Caldicoprobacter guelmensis]MBM7583398.1 penicillin-binding protein [Caldicoprobacter guelmensis]